MIVAAPVVHSAGTKLRARTTVLCISRKAQEVEKQEAEEKGGLCRVQNKYKYFASIKKMEKEPDGGACPRDANGGANG